MGLIDTIVDIDELTLTANATGSPVGNETLVAGYSLISSTESIYIRLQVGINTNNASNRDIPDFSAWRSASAFTSPSNNTYSKLEQVSSVGSPLTPATATAVNFTFLTQNLFQSYTQGGQTKYFQTATAYPAYIWIKATPNPTSTNNNLSSQTMYRWTTEETIPAITITTGTAQSVLQAAGYSNVGTAISGGGTTAGG